MTRWDSRSVVAEQDDALGALALDLQHATAEADSLRQGLAAAADYIAAALAIHTPRYAHGFTSCVHDHFTYPCPTARALGVGPSEETP